MTIYENNLKFDFLEDELIENVPTSSHKTPQFILNILGGMNHGDKITIYGTVAFTDSPITGIVYHGDETNPTIVTVFQLISDENGNYTHEIIINDDYLWKQDNTYTVSVEHDTIYKEIQFFRGNESNNFANSKILV